MSVVLLFVVSDVSQLVSGMRHDEHAIRQGLELSTAVRQASVQIGRCLVDPNAANVKQYEVIREQVRSRIQQLAAAVPTEETWRIAALGDNTQRMHDLFVSEGIVAARLGKTSEVRRIHNEISTQSTQAAEHADALARAVEGRMSHAHVLATDSTQLGLAVGLAGILLILMLSIAFTLRLRARFLQPLDVLTSAAGNLARGDFDTRVGDVGVGEFAELGRAFDHMSLELARREAQLVHTERMAAIGQLAAGVAHELNNPIGIIRGYLKTMEPDGDVDTLRDELTILDEEAAQCQRIAEDLLAYAKVGELVTEPVNAAELLQETADRFQAKLSPNQRKIEVQAADAQVVVDRARMRQVLVNLLANADGASPPNAPVKLSGRVDGSHYIIEVSDEGAGVPDTERDRVFEPFFSKRKGGSGLGLSVVLGLVQAHGGHVEVDSSESGGAVFRVVLQGAVHA
ncbi:MAG: HAMP domain-containing sensor histidine kinase [bacterium]